MSFQMPTALAAASAPRVPSIRVTASGITLVIDLKTEYTIPPGSMFVADMQSVNMGMFSIIQGQAPQRAFSNDQWVLPNNPAPDATDTRNSPLFKPGMVLPVGVQVGNQLVAAELMATTIGTRTSLEALFAQVVPDMNAAGAAGRDVAVAVTYERIQTVAMNGGNSYRVIFSDVQIIDTPKAMIEFRPQFMAVIEHAKRTPIKLPTPTSFAAPATFGAPVGTAAAWVPPVVQPLVFQTAPVNPFAQMPSVASAVLQPAAPQPSTTPAWLQAPQAPMAPPAPNDVAF